MFGIAIAGAGADATANAKIDAATCVCCVVFCLNDLSGTRQSMSELCQALSLAQQITCPEFLVCRQTIQTIVCSSWSVCHDFATSIS